MVGVTAAWPRIRDMTMTVAILRLAAWALALAMTISPVLAASLKVDVMNVRNAHGRIRIDICPRAVFLKDCAISASAPARIGTTTVIFPDLPPGRYAAQVSHDENNNNKVDRGLFGIPKEGVGFSNDAKIRMSPPKFDEAAFDHGKVPQQIGLHLRYFM